MSWRSAYENAAEAHRAGRLAEAEAGYRELLATEPRCVPALHALALALGARGVLDEALELIEAAITLEGSDPTLRNNHGNLLREAGRLDEATGAYRAALDLESGYVAAWFNLALALEGQHEFEAAETAYRAGLEHAPDDADGIVGLGAVLLARERVKEAMDCFGRARALGSKSPLLFNHAGVALHRLDRDDEAIAALRNAIELDGGYVDAWNNLGSLHASRDEFALAEQCLQRAVALRADFVQAHRNLAPVYVRTGRHDQAIAAFERILTLDPSDRITQENLASTLMRAGRRQDSERAFERLLELDPANETAPFMLATLRGESAPNAPRGYVANLFDEYASRFEADLVDRLGYRGPQQLREALDAVAGPEVRYRALADLGCGTGLGAVAFRDRVEHVFGVDLSPRMVERARGREVYDSLAVGDVVEALDGAGTRFDLVLAADVFVYVGALDAVFAAVRRAALAGAWFMFSVEEATEDGFVLRPSGRFAHSRSYVEALAERHGFSLHACESVGLRKDPQDWIPGLMFVLRVDAGEPA